MTELLTSKLDSPEFHALFTPQLEILIKVFKKHNHVLRITGGAVRDLLMGIGPTDIDFATTASPKEMKIMFTEEEIRMINLNGEKHNTVTVRINDKVRHYSHNLLLNLPCFFYFFNLLMFFHFLI